MIFVSNLRFGSHFAEAILLTAGRMSRVGKYVLEVNMSNDGFAGSNLPDGRALEAFIVRIERLEAEKQSLSDDVKDIYAEAKAQGFDPKVMRKVVAFRKMDPAKRVEERETLEIYLNALGALADLPLGQAAVARTFNAAGLRAV